MTNLRVKKLESFIQREVSELIRKEVKDPRVSPLKTTVSAVQASKDLHYVSVYISVMGDESMEEDTMKGLESARGFIQNRIGKMVKLRFTPVITFKLDDSLKRGDHIINKLNELNNPTESE